MFVNAGMTSPLSPPDETLIAATQRLRSEHPALGIPKLHVLLLSEHPDWTVSDKRFRKLLQREGLTLSSQPKTNGYATNNSKDTNKKAYPKSHINPHLDVLSYTKKVDAVFISQEKGKGLVANTSIAKDEVLWKEDPFAFVAEWELMDLQQRGLACSHCALPYVSSPPPLAANCPSCNAIFCSRLCLNRAQTAGHVFLCRTKNPSYSALLDFARREPWKAILALSSAVASILAAWERSEEEGRKTWQQWSSFATLDQEARARELPEWEFAEQRHRALWKAAFGLFISAFHPSESNKTARPKSRQLAKRPLTSEMADDLFSYQGFLRGLGRVSLNLDSQGGLFLLHSHLNHSCVPNVAMKHPPAGPNRPPTSRIQVVANRDISAGEELTVTYVNPSWGYRRRREALKEWGVECTCERCIAEKDTADEGDDVGQSGVDDLERELRMSFGV